MTKQFLYHFHATGLVPYSLAKYLNNEYIRKRTFDTKGQFLFRDCLSFIALTLYDFLFQLSNFIVIRAILKLLLFLVLISCGYVTHKLLGLFLPLRTIAFNINSEKVKDGYKKHLKIIENEMIHQENDEVASPSYKYLGGNTYHNRHIK